MLDFVVWFKIEQVKLIIIKIKEREMSVKEARAMMKGVTEVPEDIARLKKEAGRKAIMKVNAMMARITKYVAEAA